MNPPTKKVLYAQLASLRSDLAAANATIATLRSELSGCEKIALAYAADAVRLDIFGALSVYHPATNLKLWALHTISTTSASTEHDTIRAAIDRLPTQ